MISLNQSIDKAKLERFLRQPKVQNYLNISLTLATLSIFIGFAIRPSLTTAIRLNREIKQYSKIDEGLTDKILALTRARELQETYKDQLGLLDRTIPSESLESAILKNLNYVAIRNNVSLQDIFYNYTQTDSYRVIEMKINVGGNYTNILSLLTDIHTLLRVITIDSIEFNVEEASEKGLPLTGFIRARAFYNLSEEKIVASQSSLHSAKVRGSAVSDSERASSYELKTNKLVSQEQ